MCSTRLQRWLVAAVCAACWGRVEGQSGTAAAAPKAGGTTVSDSAAAAPGVDRYGAEAIVVQHWETVYRYNADGTGSKETTVAMRVQTDAAVRQFGVVTLAFASSSETLEIEYVRVRRPDGSVVETPIADAIEMPQEVTRQAPLYSDLKEKQVPVRSLRVGDVLEYRAREMRTKAEAPGQFWGQESFADGLVVLAQSLELRVPKTKEVTVWSPKSKPEVAEEGAERVYRWKGSHLQPTAGKEAEARKQAEKGTILPAEEVLALREGKLPMVAWTTFGSWAAVGAWYRGLEADREVADAAVKAKVAELVAGKSSDEEKVKALYGYVSTQVRYIGVDFGVGRYQPHAAGEVFRNQYGDCKDKHTLLAAMLKQAGFRPDAVLIGAGIRFNDAAPSPSAFNHLITVVPVGAVTVWLDSTQEVAPYRMLLYGLRDKKALVVPDAGVARVETTPETLPFASEDHFESVGTLSKEGTAQTRITLTMRGDDELLVREVLHQISPGQYEEVVQRFSQQMGFSGTTSHAEVGRPDKTEEPMRIAYDYRREKPGDDWEHFRIVPQLPPTVTVAIDEKDPPRVPIELGMKRVQRSTSSLTLPEGWSATPLEAIHGKTAFALFDQTYRFEKGTLYVERRYEVLEERVPAADWKSYKSFVDDAVQKGEYYVQLTSAGKRTGEAQPPLPTVTNAEAEKLVSEAQDEVRARSFDKAETALKAAEKMNSKQPQLWTTYGSLAFYRGEVSEAIGDYKKELELYPDELWVYDQIAQMQGLKGDRAGAKETLRQRLKEGGPSAAVSQRLAAMLDEDGDSAGAVTVLKVIDAKEQTPMSQLQLGTAEIKAGELESGGALLSSLLKDATDPALLNGVAYALADAKLQLPAAEESSRKAVEMLTKESAGWTLEGDQAKRAARESLLLAMWDTYGWVLYREGKLKGAESWIRAAWLQAPRAEIGLHLGEVEEAAGRRRTALKTYREAIASLPTSGMESGQRPSGVIAKTLEARAAALSKLEQKDDDARKDLQAQRTVRLGEAEGRTGTEEYQLLLVSGKVTEIAPGAGDGAAKKVRDGDKLMRSLDLKEWWPGGSEATLVRRGMLNCHQSVCEVVLLPL